MNKPSNSKQARLWTDRPDQAVPLAAGYDAWLAAEIAQGIADLDAGKATSLAEVRKEFGLE